MELESGDGRGGSYVSDDIDLPPSSPASMLDRLRRRWRLVRGGGEPWHHARPMVRCEVYSTSTGRTLTSYRCKARGCRAVRF